MYRDDIPLKELELGTDPVVDLHVIARFLTHWYKETPSNDYDDRKNSLRMLCLASSALDSLLSAHAKNANASHYRAMFKAIGEDMDVKITQENIEKEAKGR